MENGFVLEPAAVTLWWVTVLLVLLVFAPLAWRLLHRTWHAARQIRIYTERALAAGVGIAENTAAVSELESTRELVGAAGAVGEEIDAASTRLRDTLLERARGARP